ncbi:PucR family transcriptional regulator [Streptomyces sp. H39-S7]|uniref:PucR family transcriptional regulator n=1 Tax=Streptomyces sp. H39-S7 TaxID=3004357 RepID=UPI0022AE7E46|nr:helix-turn-helix domain-containing protein [Streptomyces sp. H39-S7]MCZ4125029.1 helix-turn-helix domain-containing protein [Streptomyces sp. H39-S7]
MTDDKSPSTPRSAELDVPGWLTANLPRLIKAVVHELTAQIPAYQTLPREELGGDISHVIGQNLRAFISVLRTRTMPDEDELLHLRVSAARRAEEGVPVEVVLTAYHLGAQKVWELLAAEAGPDGIARLPELPTLLLRYLQRVVPAVAAGYLEERQTIHGEEDAARHTLLSALLNGTDAKETADRLGLQLPAAYLVLALSMGAHPDETTAGVDPAIAGRRKARRLQTELERHTRARVLAALTAGGGIALIPWPVAPDQLAESDWQALDALVPALGRSVGADVTAGVVCAAPPGIAEAASLAREVLTIARTFDRPPGAYRLDDLLLEYQLSRPSHARDGLAALLDPLADSPEILRTIDAYLRLGSRRPVAAQLHIHPNTVDYRLQKATTLTGLDPTRPADIPLIKAALAARHPHP